ncbi:MAG TPA: hypothetical protein VK179_13350 [Bacteroidales bacterium]|nr:hypothetical protein [Bacteroidales bacterium]
MYRTFNNFLISFVILCSTSFYNIIFLSSTGHKMVDLAGLALVIVLLIIHGVYGDPSKIKRHFTVFIGLIFLSLLTSVLTAAYTREQTFVQSLFAERALFYYLFYLLLHQMRPKTSDIEKIIIVFGILHGLLFLAQFFAYPKILFDTFILIGRGTIRIYLAGSDYLAICFFMSALAFLRTNRPRYLVFMLLSFSVFILLGGRQTMALMLFVILLAILFGRKVRSRVGIFIIGGAGVVLLFFLFQPIFQGMLEETTRNRSQGADYIRFRAARYFLTDFYSTKVAYITGNGVAFSNTPYGNLIEKIKIANAYYLGDIGIIGSYVLFGVFFLAGVFGILFKGLTSKLSGNKLYIKYVFIGFTLSIITASGFEKADFICALCCLLYVIDIDQSAHKDQIALHNP